MNVERKLRADIMTACERCKPSPPIYFVYFMSSGDKYVKIGITQCVWDRIHHYHTHNPEEISLLASIPMPGKDASRILEQMLLTRFEKTHVRGEWFKKEERIMKYAEAAKKIGEEREALIGRINVEAIESVLHRNRTPKAFA